MFSRISFLILVCILFCIHAQAQEIVVRGLFLVDTVKIGEQIPYSLSVHYPSSQQVVFPDSTFSFAPFELEKKQYFPTKTTNQISRDSAVYFLSTFEIDPRQTLALPVFVIHRKDCTAVFPKPDTVFLRQLVGTIPESVEAKDLPLKTNADYLSVKWFLNYPLLLLIGGILIVVLIIVWIVFGKRIRKYFKLRRLSRNHIAFLNRFGEHLEKLEREPSSALAEDTLVLWKKYMEGLEDRPYTKLTTKEILKLAVDENLGEALHHIDRVVYAHDRAFSTKIFDELRTFAQAQFLRKTEEVNHG